MAAGHGTGSHAERFVTTIHLTLRLGGRLMMVMLFDRAMTGGTARSLIGRPCGSGERGVEQHDRKQAGDGAKRARTFLTLNAHSRAQLFPSYAKEPMLAANEPILTWLPQGKANSQK
jgi:hypothetical protein